MFIVRLRSRDGLERVKVENPHISISHFKTLIETQLKIPVQNQILSRDHNLLLAKTLEDKFRFTDISSINPQTPISFLGITHGSVLYLAYEGEERLVLGGPGYSPAGSFGRNKMTLDDLVANKQINQLNFTYEPMFQEQWTGKEENLNLFKDSDDEELISYKSDYFVDDILAKFDGSCNLSS